MSYDPVIADTERRYKELADFETSRPICAGCDQPIMSDYCCEIAGKFYCEDCYTIWETEECIDE